MPDINETCSTGNKTISCVWGTAKSARITVGSVPALLKITISSIQVNSSITNYSNISKISFRGGTQSGYSIVYYGLWGSASSFALETHIVVQNLQYIDLIFEQVDFPVSGKVLDTNAQFTLTYKVECPIVSGGRIDLHFGNDTKANSCNLNYVPSGSSGDTAWTGFR